MTCCRPEIKVTPAASSEIRDKLTPRQKSFILGGRKKRHVVMQKAVLNILASGKPLFSKIPVRGQDLNSKIIIGTESEYGVGQDKNGQPTAKFHRLPEVFTNGGKAYKDLDHVEYCTPETSNAVAAVAYYEAGKLICRRKGYSSSLHCNNCDWHGNTFGAHQNFLTRAPREKWPLLIPFLVVRTLIGGSGWINRRGWPEISQRASFMVEPIGGNSTADRAILHTRIEPLCGIRGFDRLHLICSDAHMLETALFLDLGVMGLVVELLEQNALPAVGYNLEKAVADMQSISRSISNWETPTAWPLAGAINEPKEALDLLSRYWARLKSVFGGRDLVTDTLIIVLGDTIEKLSGSGDPIGRLYGRLDWATKISLLRDFKEDGAGGNVEWLKSADLEYHDLNPDKGLYYYLRDREAVERVVSNELIEWAATEPPEDTRAFARGKAAAILSSRKPEWEIAADSAWTNLRVVDAWANRPTGDEYHGCTAHHLNITLDDPFRHYEEVIEEVVRLVEKRQ